MRTLLIAVLVGVIASAGSATAASVITGKQIRNGTITGADVKNRSIGAADLKRDATNLRRGSIRTAQLSQAAVNDLQATLATTRVSRSEPLIYSAEDGWSPKSINIECPVGQVALGGGGGFVEKPYAGQIGSSGPILDGEGKPYGWRLAGSPVTADNRTLEVYAICAP